MIGMAAAGTAMQLYNTFFAGDTAAEKAAKAQAERIGQQTDLHKMLQGIFDKPNQGFQSDALSAALADKNLMGMAPGFARMQLVKQMLGIGGGGTGALDAANREDAQQAASAQQMGEALGMLINQSSDTGPSALAQSYYNVGGGAQYSPVAEAWIPPAPGS
jgi:hypothetical protein